MPHYSGELTTEGYSRPKPKVSPRHIEVLTAASQGLMAKEIGKKLGIAESTVENHARDIFKIMEVRNMVAAVAKAIREGIIE